MSQLASDPAAHPTRIWSLRRRLTVWIAMGVTVLVASGVTFVIWFMNDSLGRELDALVEEELAELTVPLRGQPLDKEAFFSVGRTLNAQHPEFLVSIRGFRQESRRPWAESGSPWPDEAAEPLSQATPRIRGIRRGEVVINVTFSGAAPLQPELATFEILVDGSPRANHVGRVGAAFLIFALLGGVLATASGAFLSSRLSKVLREIADSAGAQRLDGDMLVPVSSRAPEEIRGVVEAIRSSVQQMRDEHGRNVLLTAGLAHELRSPLQNAMADTEVTLLRERSGEEYRDTLRRIYDELHEFALVVDNLIAMTAIRDTTGLGRRERFDFVEEARMRLTREESDARRKGVELRFDAKGEAHFDGDREALVLMLRNLVSNAIRWSPEGTGVEVGIDGRLEELLVYVEDQGPGIPEGERELIFEAFRQGPAPEGRRTGYGLGLALARAAAHAHGGEIRVADSAGRGARFEVRLPRGPFPGDPPKPPPRPKPGGTAVAPA